MARRPRNTLREFGALSLVLHIVLFAGLAHQSIAPTWHVGESFSRDGEITIALSLPASRVQSRAFTTLATDANEARPEQHRAPVPGLTQIAQEAAAEGGPPAAAILGEVRNRLARYLAYPPLARARGWEGTVLVGFRLASDGRLEALRVARSSGYDILDASAIDSLGKVGRLDDVATMTLASAQQLELAVMYRLENR